MVAKSAIRRLRDTAVWAGARAPATATIDGIMLSTANMSLRMRSVLLRGTYEREDIRLCRKYLTSGSRVIEVGSAIGFVALYCMKAIGVRAYAMIEANPALLTAIGRNFELNDIPPPQLLNVVVGGEDGVARFFVNRDFWSSSLTDRNGTERSVTMPMMTLPTAIAQMGYVPDTLIMDIEGGEQFIPVAHMARFDTIIAELHPHIIGQTKVDAIVSDLASAGLIQIETDDLTHVFRREGPS